jgi:hypothetical protein
MSFLNDDGADLESPLYSVTVFPLNSGEWQSIQDQAKGGQQAGDQQVAELGIVGQPGGLGGWQLGGLVVGEPQVAGLGAGGQHVAGVAQEEGIRSGEKATARVRSSSPMNGDDIEGLDLYVCYLDFNISLLFCSSGESQSKKTEGKLGEKA